MHVCIPLSIFKCVAVGIPAQTRQAEQLRGKYKDWFKLETEEVLTFLQYWDLPCPFSMQRDQKSQVKYGKDLWNHMMKRLLIKKACLDSGSVHVP